MSTPQAGIFIDNSTQFYHLEYLLDKSLSSKQIREALGRALRDIPNKVNVVTCFGNDVWDRLQPDWRPEDLVSFSTISGSNDFVAPSTQRDVYFWIHSSSIASNLDCALAIQHAMRECGSLQLDLPGFTYHDSRDLTGFIDGTANPKDSDRQLVALVPEGNQGAGGSYVLTQKWVHDLNRFNGLSVHEQEQVIGRTKPDSIELTGNDMPADSHVSRTDVKINGKAMKIYRRSTPFGSVSEHGLYFLSFSCEIEHFDIQLKRMFGATADGLHDRIIDYSSATTGSYWFAPSAEDLKDLLI